MGFSEMFQNKAVLIALDYACISHLDHDLSEI